MLKPIALATCLALALAGGGCATHVPPSARTAASPPSCVRETGSRIAKPDSPCVNAPGASYTQEDLQRTGEINVGDALKKMDPRLQ
jgi:hypothetical protein